MDKLYVLFLNNRLIGVYTSHRKATQVICMENADSHWHLMDYSFQFGMELFAYQNPEKDEKVYEIQEVTPDIRA